MRELQALALSQMPARSVRQHSLQASSILLLISPRPKAGKYLEGYPGDTEETVPSSQGETGGGETHRPPRSNKPTLDEDAVKRVEERMKSLDVSSQASAA